MVKCFFHYPYALHSRALDIAWHWGHVDLDKYPRLHCPCVPWGRRGSARDMIKVFIKFPNSARWNNDFKFVVGSGNDILSFSIIVSKQLNALIVVWKHLADTDTAKKTQLVDNLPRLHRGVAIFREEITTKRYRNVAFSRIRSNLLITGFSLPHNY